VADNDLDDGDDTHDNGKDTRRQRDADVGVSDGLGDGSPSRDRRDGEGAVVITVPDARIGSSEEYKQTGAEPDRDENTNGLGHPLLDRGSANEETGTEVANKSSGGISTTRREGTSDQVELLGVLNAVVAVRSGSTEDELRGLGGSSKRGVVRDGSDLDSEEREKESEEDSKDGETAVHLPLEVEDKNTGNKAGKQTNNPHPVFDLLLRREGILDSVLGLLPGGSMLGEEGALLAALLQSVVDAAAGVVPKGLDAGPDSFILDEELSHGGADHDHDTGPEKPITRRWGDLAEVLQRGE